MRRRQLIGTGSLVLLIGAHQIARGASVVAVRIWPARDYTRVTIESDGALTARQFFVSRVSTKCLRISYPNKPLVDAPLLSWLTEER